MKSAIPFYSCNNKFALVYRLLFPILWDRDGDNIKFMQTHKQCSNGTAINALKLISFEFDLTLSECLSCKIPAKNITWENWNLVRKIKWFAIFCLGRFRKYGLWFEAMQFFWIYFVVACAINFIVLCLSTRFPSGWFVQVIITPGHMTSQGGGKKTQGTQLLH